LVGYQKYLNEESAYSTQHGVKGAEFERVMVILNDEEGNMNTYSYEKLFGIK
jgi:DNA helicase-2/ATP-dependent DNA helicase PcrA